MDAGISFNTPVVFMAMFVPIQQRQASPELVKLPLIKFSYVTTASLHGPLPWTHLPQGSDLSAVFETVTSPTNDGHIQRRVLFKVIVGDHALVSNGHWFSF